MQDIREVDWRWAGQNFAPAMNHTGCAGVEVGRAPAEEKFLARSDIEVRDRGSEDRVDLA